MRSVFPSSTWIILGPPGSGKTTFVENLVRMNAHRYPVCRVNTSIPTAYKRYCEIFPSVCVFNEFDESEETKFIERQTSMALKYDNPGRFAVYILDDIKKFGYGGAFFKDLFQKGSRHYNLLTILVNQNALEFPPALRNATTYTVIFKFKNEADKKKLYENYGSRTLFGSFNNFVAITDELTNNYTCVIIKNLLTEYEDDDIFSRVFYYKLKYDMSLWKFGCNELQKLSVRQLDPNISEFP